MINKSDSTEWELVTSCAVVQDLLCKVVVVFSHLLLEVNKNHRNIFN